MGMKKIAWTAFALLFVLLAASIAAACPACKEILSSQEDPAAASRIAKGFSWSLGLLLSTPYLLFAGITFLIVRSTRRKRQAP